MYFSTESVCRTRCCFRRHAQDCRVILPSTLTFNVSTPELMEITSGTCRVKIGDEPEFKTYAAGDRFSVAANSRFVIEANEVVNYVCSFG